MSLGIENRISQLSPKAKKLFLKKIDGFLKTKKEKSGIEKKRLVAYVEGKEGFDIENLKDQLKSTLPNYMIPSSIINLEKMPLLPNGKIDRKNLYKYNNASKTSVVKTSTVNVSNSNKIETQLIKIWEETLGFSPIHKGDNFFEIGGDSILSIQIIAKARKEGIILESNDIFDYQTIEELALFAKTEKQEAIENTVLEGIVPLSPIQHWFFNDHKNAPHYWNQGVRLDNLPSATKHQVQKVCNYLITFHDALRSKFVLKNNVWTQEIIAVEQISPLHFVAVNDDLSQIHKEQLVQEKLKEVQQQFNLEKGSLFKCIYFSTGTTNFCMLIAHHLIVDAVSWQIIIEDFSSIFQKVTSGIPITTEPKTSSIKAWNGYLHGYANNIANEEFTFWKNQIIPVPKLPIDKENHTIIEEQDIQQFHFEISKEITQSLIEANQVYNTTTEELLIAAFLTALVNWTNKHEISLGFERHGRETLSSGMDLSKTVGWFTSYFPVRFTCPSSIDIKDKIITTKEQMRRIPNGGIGYGTLRYLKKVFGEIENPEIVFNYLGTKNTSSDNGIKVTPLSKNLRDPKSERHYKLELNIQIINNQLKGVCSYGDQIYYEETIRQLISNFKECTQEITIHCSQVENGSYTPSDFSDIDISQDDLDNLLDILE